MIIEKATDVENDLRADGHAELWSAASKIATVAERTYGIQEEVTIVIKKNHSILYIKGR